MKASIIVAIILLFSELISSQWLQQNSGTSDILNCVYFINEFDGWVGTNQGEILKTTDGGDTWVSISTGTTNSIKSIYFINEEIGWCVATNYSGNGEGLIFKTTSGGNDWVGKYNSTTQLESIFFINENIGWAVGTAYFIGGQIIKTVDAGENWIVNSTLSNPSRPYDVYFQSEQVGFVVGGEPGRIYKTVNNGQTWSEIIDSSSSTFLDISFANDSTGITLGWNNSLAKTTNKGLTWERFFLGTFDSFYGVNYRLPKVWIIGGTYNYILNSDNNGLKWFPQMKIDAVSFTDIHFINDTVGWAVGTSGTILKTTNSGNPLVGYPIIPILIHPSNNEVNVSLPVYFEWENIDYSTYELQVSVDSLFSELLLDIRLIDNFYFISLTFNSDFFWRVKSENLNGYSEWSEIYKFTTGITDVDEAGNISYKFKLEQNFPNPFNPTTKLKYSIPLSENVQIKIFDILGLEVMTLINEYKKAGTYEIEFNANNLSSGIYFYRIISGEYIETKKMLLLR
jgi:photosystem II stability/assembly factor-like uncharacterized protein